MSEAGAWEDGRGCWAIEASRTIDENEVQIVNDGGTIPPVAIMSGLRKPANPLEFIGDLLQSDERVETVAGRVSKAQNSIS